MIGEDENSYKYVKGNSIKEKINYSYSTFEGKQFLKAWDLVRKNCIKIILENKSNIVKHKDSETTTFLKLLIKNPLLIKNKENDIHLLIKRFEVTKRIYSHYDLNFKRINRQTSFDDIYNYIYFGILLTKLFENNKHLQYLNTILKVNDIICREILNSSNLIYPQSECLYLLKQESKIVKTLIKGDGKHQ